MDHLRVNPKVRLEAVNLSMAPVIFEAIDRDRDFLTQWLPFVEYTQKLSDTENFINSLVNQTGKKRDEVFVIWYKGEFAGLIGFKDTDWVNRKTELGYWLTKNMQGKGIITSCVDKLNVYAFKKLKMNRIQIKVAKGNSKSAAIPVKLGFQFEGTERAGELHCNKFFDLEVYSLLKSDLKNFI
ncbi:MAG: GNAT family N-acetyltransferase [Bacteroidota bacterium]